MLQGSEILIILLVALVVLGPQRLPEIARKLGNWSVELKRAARDFRLGLEAEVADFKEVGRDVRRPFDEVNDELRATGRAVDGEKSDLRRLGWVGPEPRSGPTHADALEDLDQIEGGSPPATAGDTHPPAESDSHPPAANNPHPPTANNPHPPAANNPHPPAANNPHPPARDT